jgi:prepilin-type N-terminal cleavage/methylation domain-containing protein
VRSASIRVNPRRKNGFTLIEILVAIAILAALAGMLLPMLGGARKAAAAKAAKATIERIKLAAEAYCNDFGDYPPTSLASLGVSTNGANEGNESLVRCLTTRAEHGPYLAYDEKDLANTDSDHILGDDPLRSAIAAKDLFELVDPWNNPYIYFHHRDYKSTSKLERYIFFDGSRPSCRPQPSAKTGTYPAPTGFMIWSAGPNGENENGEGDDVCSWK